jgi:cyclic dehypoxanthinyl futalosine synthase
MGISTAQALHSFTSNDLLGIGMEADALRRSLHPEGVVSYLIDRRIPLSAALCNDPEALYILAREALDLGATGLHLDLPPSGPIPSLAALEAILIGLRDRCPALVLHGLSATAVVLLAQTAALTQTTALTQTAAQTSSITLPDNLAATLAILRDAGLTSLGGEDAFLTPEDNPADATAPAASTHLPAATWFEVHRTAHQLGLSSTAVMVFGLGESPAARIHHLESLRDLQQETGGFTSFTPLAFQPSSRTTPSTSPKQDPPTAVEYLRTLAIARLILSNIPHIQSSNTAQGLKVVQMALRFGANDTGSISLDGPPAHHGSPNRISEEDLRRVIRDAGFRPAQRDTLFHTLYLDN